MPTKALPPPEPDEEEDPEELPPVRLTDGQVHAIGAAQSRNTRTPTTGRAVELYPHQGADVVFYALGIQASPEQILGDPTLLAMAPVWGVRKRVVHLTRHTDGRRLLSDEASWVLIEAHLLTALRALARLGDND
jgi:hypothetical protein